MPNRFTRVPAIPPPPLSRLGRLALPLADFYCVILLSRPASGSLATTWVTPGSLLLSILVFFFAVPTAIASVSPLGLPRLLGVLVALAFLILALCALALASVGIDQRLQFHFQPGEQPPASFAP